jgi:predicted nucleic acid-binding protein
MKCLDSTFLIDLMKNDEGAVNKAREMEGKILMATTEINVFEIASGIELGKVGDAKKRQKMGQAGALFNRLNVLPLDREGALRGARIVGELKRKGSPVDVLDALVAGISLTHGCDVVVTRNKRHFEHVKGLKVETY